MLFQFKAIIFIVASVGFAWLTRSSLRNRRSHGFYRFLTWEAIVVLILLNLDYWFHEPFSTHQMVSWLLLTVSSFLVIHGVYSLHMLGKPDSEREDPSLIGIEKTTELVMEGAYRYIRHPLYSSLLFLTWGTFFKNPSWAGVLLTGIATFFLIKTAKVEEFENMRFFGTSYKDYMKQTKMFVPFLF